MSEWKEYRVSELCQLIGGGTPKTTVPEYWGGNIPWLSVTDFNTGKKYCFDADKKITEKALKESSTKILKKGQLIISARGTVGVISMLGRDMAFNQSNYGIDAKKELTSNDYLYYLLKDNVPQFISNSYGAVFDTITKETFEQIKVLLPSISEQIQIASILSSLDDKIDLLQRQNKTLEQLAETLFRQWFVEEAEESWETKKVKDVCITISKGTTPTTLGKQFKETGINFIKAESLTDVGGFLPEKFAFIDTDTDELLKRSRIQKGDILITIAGTIGRIAYAIDEILPANTNQAIGFMRVNKEIITSYFLYCLFKTSEVRNDFEGRVVHAVQPNLSLGEIGDIEFKMPPQETLKNGMKELENLFSKKEKNQTQIRTLTQLRDTLLPKLMSGEVRVKN